MLTGNETPSPPDVLHHYTDAAGLLGIVKGRALWATHIRFMNDAREFVHAIDMAANLLQHLRSQQDSIILEQLAQNLAVFPATSCVISFSENGDLLSQWRGYCRNGGYSLDFHTDKLLQFAQEQRYSLVKCTYDRALQAELVKNLVIDSIEAFPSYVPHGNCDPNMREVDRANLFAIQWFFPRMHRLAYAMKDPAFSEEREWRLVGSLFKFDPPMKFRVRGSIIIPFDTFELGSDSEVAFQGVIDRVLVGPHPDQQLAVLGIDMMHKWGDLSDASIETSSIPYRI